MTLFDSRPGVLNVGIASFAEAIRRAGADALEIEWSPPAGGDANVGRDLAALVNHPAVETANRTAYARYLAAQPVLEGVGVARSVIPPVARVASA